MLKARRTQHKGLTNFSIVIYEKKVPPKKESESERDFMIGRLSERTL